MKEITIDGMTIKTIDLRQEKIDRRLEALSSLLIGIILISPFLYQFLVFAF